LSDDNASFTNSLRSIHYCNRGQRKFTYPAQDAQGFLSLILTDILQCEMVKSIAKRFFLVTDREPVAHLCGIYPLER
jgi:hypothetical protein